MYKKASVVAVAMLAAVVQAIPAAACGGLVAPNGAIRLSRASTYVDWRDGVEHYLTSFSYQGTGFSEFGWIVPLPAVPTKVEEGGGWTLQRLNRETHPLRDAGIQFAGAALNAPAAAEVLITTTVRALDITVLRGSGESIAAWCAQNNFLLTPETRAHLVVYSHGSPIFMAAKYNVARAQSTGQLAGDGAPVLVTMPTAHPWVPLEVLANGTDHVTADLYFTTDRPLYASDLAAAVSESARGESIPGAFGLAVQYQEPVSPQLHRDLSSDKNMGWLRPGGWLTYMTLDAPARAVTFDLGISSAGVVRVAPYGTIPMKVADYTRQLPGAPASPPALPPGVRTVAWVSFLALIALTGAAYASRRA